MASRRELRKERKFHEQMARAAAEGRPEDIVRMMSEHDGPVLTGDDFRRMYGLSAKKSRR
ncbi:MAG: hypothetical protein JW990_11770 [Thermoleophilia bacterium]|nr:hypothetical protein [Thermoleophilia bacterium]